MATIPAASDCTSTTLFAYVVLQLTPWIVPAILYAVSHVREEVNGRWVRQFVLVAFANALALGNAALWLFQVVHPKRPDPFCPMFETYAMPSSLAYNLAAVTAFFLAVAWHLRFWYSITNTLILVCGVFVVPAVLVWFGYNTWQEVLLSSALGVITTVLFTIVVWNYLADDLPYLMVQAPYSWANCGDTWILNNRQRRKAEQLRRWLDTNESAYGSLEVLCF